MIRCQRVGVILGVALVLALGAGPAAAEVVLIAPVSVQADGDGSFSYVAQLFVGDGCVGLTGYGYFGVENVTGGEWADTFCIDPQPVAPGTVVNIAVSGTLTDPAQPGRMYVTSGCCTGGFGEAETLVVAPTVPDAPTAWGALKARYR